MVISARKDSLLTGAVQVSYENSFQSFSYTPPFLVLDASQAVGLLWVAKEKSLDISIRDFSFTKCNHRSSMVKLVFYQRIVRRFSFTDFLDDIFIYQSFKI